MKSPLKTYVYIQYTYICLPYWNAKNELVILDSLNPGEPKEAIRLLRLIQDKFEGNGDSDVFCGDESASLKRGSSSDTPNKRLCFGLKETGRTLKLAHAYCVIW